MNTNKSFLGKTFAGWTVMTAVKNAGNHKTYVLVNEKANTATGKNTYSIMTLRDNALYAIANGDRTIESYVTNKEKLVKRKIRSVANTINHL